MAKQAWSEYALDEVWLMPAGHSPNKDETAMVPAADRLTMAKLAVGICKSSDGDHGYNQKLAREQYPYMNVTPIEINSEGTSYTYRTLQRLCNQFPMHSFFFLMGADSLDYFEKWMHPEIICEKAAILVVNRDSFLEQDLSAKIAKIKHLFPADIRIVHCSKYDISSSQIRKMIRMGEDCAQYLPAGVWAYIRQHHLYVDRGISHDHQLA